MSVPTIGTEELSGVIRIEKGRPPHEQPYDGPDSALYLTPGYLRGRSDAVRVKPGPTAVRVGDGDTVIIWDGGNAGEILRGRDGILASTMVRVTHPERYEPTYFYYALKSAEGFLKALTSGSDLKHVDPELLGRIRIRFRQREDQLRVAAVLSTVDAALEQTHRLIAKQERIRSGLLADLLTLGIDDNGNLRSSATHEFMDSPVGRIPVEWEFVPLKTLAHVSSGVTLGAKHVGTATIELPYLRVANVQDGYLDLREVKTIRVPTATVEKYLLRPGDVLMNEGGDFDKLGRGTVWRGEIDPCVHQNHVFKVRPRGNLLHPDFLAAVSASNYGKSYFVLASKQSTNLASINATQLRAFQIPRPDYDEQVRIVKVIQQHRAHVAVLTSEAKKLAAMKRGLLSDLLAVPADLGAAA